MENIFDDLLDEGTKVEQKIETQPENTTEVIASQEIQVEEPKTEQPLNFDFGVFNKKFGGEWDEEKIKGIIEKGSKYDEVLTEKDSYSKRVSELEGLEKIDPLSFFSSEDSYIREQFLLKNKDTDPSVLNVLTNLSPSKIEKLSDFDALTTKMLIDNPDTDGGIEGVKEIILDRLGLSEEELADYDNLDRVTKNKIKLEAKSAKGDLKKLYEGIELPKKVDIAQTRVQIKESWESPLKEIVKGIDKLSLAEGFDFVVTDEMKQGLFEESLSDVTNGLIKPSTDSASEIAGKLRSKLRDRYFDKIIETVQKDADEKAKAKYKSQVHNDKPLNEQSRSTSAGLQFEDVLDKW